MPVAILQYSLRALAGENSLDSNQSGLLDCGNDYRGSDYSKSKAVRHGIDIVLVNYSETYVLSTTLSYIDPSRKPFTSASRDRQNVDST